MRNISCDCILYLLVPCYWEEYGPWSECSKSCGEGLRIRIRKKGEEEAGKGKPCEGQEEERETCLVAECPGA